MKSLSGEFIYSMDKNHDPVLRIDPGETVAVDTLMPIDLKIPKG